MIRLVTHLEHLLRIHDCVIVPQLGGFVLQFVPALYVEEEHSFQPMHKEIVFNAKLKHNDGLLYERYMQAFGVSFRQARRMLEEDVTIINDELRKGLTVSLGAVGNLHQGTEGQVIFTTGNPETFSVDSYGLTSFNLNTWEFLQKDVQEAESVTQKRKQNALNVTVNRRVLRVVSASAAAIALFFLISTPVSELNKDSYKASFIPQGSISSFTWPNNSEDEDETFSPEDFGAIESDGYEEADSPSTGNGKASRSSGKEKASQTKNTPVKVTENPQSASANIAEKQNVADNTETYYIVIGSVNSRKQADDFIAYNVDFGTMPNANTIVAGNMVRIYADKYNNKTSAEAYLAKVRNNPQFFDAWMFTQKK